MLCCAGANMEKEVESEKRRGVKLLHYSQSGGSISSTHARSSILGNG